MPARRGDWTRLRNRVSRSLSASGRVAVARRAVKVRSSTGLPSVPLSDAGGWNHRARSPATARGSAVVLGLIPLDELVHADGVRLPVAVTPDGARSAGC